MGNRFRPSPRALGVVAGTAVLLLSSAPGWSGSFDRGFKRAEAQWRRGNAAGALETYRELLVEYPDSEALLFGMGCAQYLQGERDLEMGAPAKAPAAFAEANASFERLQAARDRRLRVSAGFNRANCTVQAVKLMPPERHEEQVSGLRAAVAAYEDVLRDAETSRLRERAAQNLDHARYLLKRLLQDPPKEAEQQGPAPRRGNPDQGEAEKPPEEFEGHGKEEASPEKEEESSESSNAASMSSQAQGQNVLDKPEIEAILQSLENIDRREQKVLRNARGPVRVRGDWW